MLDGGSKQGKAMVALPVERVHVELTNHCNFSCRFCPDGVMTRPRGFMAFDVVQRVLQEVAREKIARQVHFHVMGEPMLHPRLADAVAEAAGFGLATCLTTNGSLLDATQVQALEAAGLSRLVVSVQTPDPESFPLRGAGKLTYAQYEARIVDALRPVLERPGSMRVTLNFLTTPLPWILGPPGERLRIADRSRRLRRQLEAWATALLGEGHPRAASVLRQIRRARTLVQGHVALTERVDFETRITGDWAVHYRDPQRLVRARFGACNGLVDNFGILWNGDFVFCCVDYDGRTATHNIRQTSVLEYLRSPQVHRVVEGFRRFRVVHPYCQQCLGDYGVARSWVRQAGSILYFKVLRRFMDRRRL